MKGGKLAVKRSPEKVIVLNVKSEMVKMEKGDRSTDSGKMVTEDRNTENGKIKTGVVKI